MTDKQKAWASSKIGTWMTIHKTGAKIQIVSYREGGLKNGAWFKSGDGREAYRPYPKAIDNKPDPVPPPKPEVISRLPGRGSLVRAPGGNIERPAEWNILGLDWFPLNIRGMPTPQQSSDNGDYRKLRQMLSTNGKLYFPWQHCFKPQDIFDLFIVANRWRDERPHRGDDYVGINVEQELAYATPAGYLPPTLIAEATKVWEANGGKCIDIFLGWIQNTVTADPIAHHTCLLEVFPVEATSLMGPDGKAKTLDCIDHAQQKGFDDVIPLFGTYSRMGVWHTPDMFDLTMHHGLYTYDDMGPRYPTWVVS